MGKQLISDAIRQIKDDIKDNLTEPKDKSRYCTDCIHNWGSICDKCLSVYGRPHWKERHKYE